MKRSNDWRVFEKFVERIQRSLHPRAQISVNERLPGQNSKVSRQIDVVIRQKIGITDILIVVDCKQRSRKTDLNAMGEFVQLKEDVGAHSGIMITEKGFSKGALRNARRHNIQAFTVAQTIPDSWEIRIGGTVLMEHWVLTPTLLEIVHREAPAEQISDDRLLELTDVQTGQAIVPAELVKKLWNALEEKREGHFKHSLPVNGHPSICAFVLAFKAEPLKTLRPASLRVVGLTDVETGLTHSGDLRLETSGDMAAAGNHFTVLIRKTEVRTMQNQFPDPRFVHSDIALQLAPDPPLALKIREAKQARTGERGLWGD